MSSSGMERREFIALGVGALAVAAMPGLLRPEERLVRHTVPMMGTLAEIAVPARNGAAARGAIRAAVAELHRVESLMTRFRPGSDVGRLNAAPAGSAVAVSPETAEVVREALRWAHETDGIFDPCLGGLSGLWDAGDGASRPDGAERVRSLPAQADIRGLSGRRFWLHLAVEGDAGAPVLRREHPLALVDLGGIAKGYGVDRASQVLRDQGVFRALVNVGGDLMALGDGPAGRAWRIGIRDPANPSGVERTLEIADAAVATSGDYVRYFTHGGRRYHHLLDGETGAPRQTALRTITVTAADVRSADAAATAAFGLGADRAPSTLARLHPGIRVAHAG